MTAVKQASKVYAHNALAADAFSHLCPEHSNHVLPSDPEATDLVTIAVSMTWCLKASVSDMLMKFRKCHEFGSTGGHVPSL